MAGTTYFDMVRKVGLTLEQKDRMIALLSDMVDTEVQGVRFAGSDTDVRISQGRFQAFLELIEIIEKSKKEKKQNE